jgi:ATP-dependent DNA helicase RecG
MQTMVSTNDGFVIAEVDLELRGPGDLEGTQQSGLPFDFKIANIGQDGQILQLARNTANDILDEDKLLNYPKNSILKFQLDKMQAKKLDFSQIS